MTDPERERIERTIRELKREIAEVSGGERYHHRLLDELWSELNRLAALLDGDET